MDAAAAAESQNDSTTAATYYRNVYAREPSNVRAATGLMRTLREMGALGSSARYGGQGDRGEIQRSRLWLAKSARCGWRRGSFPKQCAC